MIGYLETDARKLAELNELSKKVGESVKARDEVKANARLIKEKQEKILEAKKATGELMDALEGFFNEARVIENNTVVKNMIIDVEKDIHRNLRQGGDVYVSKHVEDDDHENGIASYEHQNVVSMLDDPDRRPYYYSDDKIKVVVATGSKRKTVFDICRWNTNVGSRLHEDHEYFGCTTRGDNSEIATSCFFPENLGKVTRMDCVKDNMLDTIIDHSRVMKNTINVHRGRMEKGLQELAKKNSKAVTEKYDEMVKMTDRPGFYLDENERQACKVKLTDGKLNLSNRDLKRIPPCLAKHGDNLKQLDLYGTKVSKIENLDNLVNLKSLRLSGTPVSTIENLDKNVNLEYIGLNNTPVSRIENLDANVNLKELGLSDTAVSRIENLDNLVNLEDLWLRNTKVIKIENLEHNTKLVKLWLENTPVSTIENLDKNVNLKTLDLGKTKVPGEDKRAFEVSRPGLTVW